MIHNDAIVLAGDIGGTNARFVLFRNGEYLTDSFRAIPVAGYSDLGDVIAEYQMHIGEKAIQQAAFSVATTAEYRDHINLTNVDLQFSISGLRQRFSLSRAKVVNDFTAAALGVVCLSEDCLQLLHKGNSDPAGPRAVIGPGTGLGVSGLLHTGE